MQKKVFYCLQGAQYIEHHILFFFWFLFLFLFFIFKLLSGRRGKGGGVQTIDMEYCKGLGYHLNPILSSNF